MRRGFPCVSRRWRRRRDRSDCLSRGRAVRAPAVVFQTLQDAPSGWTCSSSALRFRVDTAGPESSLTMVPRSPAGGFVVTSRGVRVGGFPQPFCNERSCFGSGGCVGAVAQFIFVNALGLVFCILKHARRHAFAVITLRAAPFRARNFARIFVVMGASDAALKLADRGGAGRVAGLVNTAQNRGARRPAQGPPPQFRHAGVFLNALWIFQSCN